MSDILPGYGVQKRTFADIGAAGKNNSGLRMAVKRVLVKETVELLNTAYTCYILYTQTVFPEFLANYTAVV